MTEMYCHLFTCNSYNSCNRHTRTIKMVYFHNSFEYRQKSATYAAKSFQLLGASPPDPLTSGSAPGPRWGHSPRRPRPPSSTPPILAISPKLKGLDKTLQRSPFSIDLDCRRADAMHIAAVYGNSRPWYHC